MVDFETLHMKIPNVFPSLSLGIWQAQQAFGYSATEIGSALLKTHYLTYFQIIFDGFYGENTFLRFGLRECYKCSIMCFHKMNEVEGRSQPMVLFTLIKTKRLYILCLNDKSLGFVNKCQQRLYFVTLELLHNSAQLKPTYVVLSYA